MKFEKRTPRFEKRTPELRLKLEGWRSRLVLVLAIGGFAVLLGRAFYLQALDHGFLQAKGEARYTRVIELPASRGPVKDRNGQLLAVSTAVESIWAIPDELDDVQDAKLRALAAALGENAAGIRQKIANKDRQFVYLKRQISPDQAAKVMALHVPGVFQQREFRRYYPAGEVMAHVVGFTGIEDNGQEGIELAAQRRLAGTPGSRKVIKDRRGRVVEDVESLRPPRDGQDVTLAIDQRLQFLAHRELRTAVETNHAKGGSAVIVDARTGEVLALVNQPDYNPNNRAMVTGRQTRNRSVTDVFEPGSTLKPFTIAAALDDGLVKPDTIIQTAPGKLTIGRATISDAHAHGALTVAQVIQKSSNIGTAKIQLMMPAKRMGTVYEELGFGAPPHTGFPGEARGLLRPWAHWRPIEQATMAYGQGIAVSLLQVARAYTVFTNGGVLLPLSLLRQDAPAIGKRIYSAETVVQVDRMMEMAVGREGTAPLAQVPGYRVAGKTGTAYKAERGGYDVHRYVASFVGFAPVSDPRFIVAVMLDEPSAGKHFGGDVSAPVFASVMGAALRMMSVPPDAPQTFNVQAGRAGSEG
ncbi:MAG TPA: penicillin-binding protein 2 [Usitatibacter sp.]|nr:penicillin-binding protein 2 [Usitatibacter sp.]